MWRLTAAASFRWRRGTTQLSALSGAERDDAADRIVRRYANCDAVAGNDFDSKAAHSAAQLRQHFMARITLHAVQTARVNRNHGSLHVYQIVFAQSGVLLNRREMSGLGRTSQGLFGISSAERLAGSSVFRGAFRAATRVPHRAFACKFHVFSG